MDFSDLPCDWRISIVHCKRGDVFLTIQKVALFVVSVALIAVIFTLLQRIVFLHGRLWTSAGVSSIEALLALIGLHFIGRIATHVCLIWDALPPTSMSLLWEIPWLVGEIGLQSFVVGVATSSTAAGKWKKSAGRRHSAVSNFILPSKRAVYTAVYTQLAVQVITNVTLAYYAGRYDYSMSVMEWPWRWYHISHYSLWCFYLLLLSAAFIFYSMRLLKELKSASKDLDKLALEESRVQKAVARLRLQFLLVGIIYGSFGLILGSFAWMRHLILSQLVISTVLCLGWNILVPAAMIVFCWVTFMSDLPRTRRYLQDHSKGPLDSGLAHSTRSPGHSGNAKSPPTVHDTSIS